MNEKNINIINIFISLIVILISFYSLLTTELKTQSLIIFGIITVIIILIFIPTYLYNRYKKLCEDIKDNKENIDEIKKHLNYKDLFNTMDTRLTIIEKLFNKKKGQIDPRIIGWILLIILFILLIKSLN